MGGGSAWRENCRLVQQLQKWEYRKGRTAPNTKKEMNEGAKEKDKEVGGLVKIKLLMNYENTKNLSMGC